MVKEGREQREKSEEGEHEDLVDLQIYAGENV